ncbi:zinc ribbon domain-containing protein [Streptomyces sp. CoH27]|uniref:zinc ribbon domain-containing protein n=1 Tax=Streptomyces sp. CoH27 TaxID=2875763 RepID=UPI001CD733D9|nr:zinc ribbon domain-containing protein [Streptomyces sp. CoH27]
MCSACGSIEGPKGLDGLGIRKWTCSCGDVHDRDENAELNSRREGRRIVAEGRPDT